MYDRKASGALIQSKRLEFRLTQEQLAEKVGCSVRHIVNVERGSIGLSIDTMLRICEIFRITPNELLFPKANADDSEINWLIESMKTLQPEERKIAISIVSPYVENAIHGRK